MKNVPDKKRPTTKDPKMKATLRIIIPLFVLLIALCILFVLHTSGSYALGAGDINESLVTGGVQETGNNSQETKIPESSIEEVFDATLALELVPTAVEPSEEIEPTFNEETTPQPETTPDSDPEAPTEHIHIYKDSVIAPTCSNKGYTLRECNCGHKYTDNEQESCLITILIKLFPQPQNLKDTPCTFVLIVIISLRIITPTLLFRLLNPR